MQKRMSSMMFEELPRLNCIRKENAQSIARDLLDSGNYMIPGYDKNDCPAYIRLPVLCPNKDRRENAIAELKKLGINSTAMYPSSIDQIPGIDKFLSGGRDDYPGARRVADCLLTLPTHPFLKKAHIKKIISVLNELK
jgi:dTDP-4-amino-4,6-dideoxygalactose transaminase